MGNEKLNIGCGPNIKSGWCNIDMHSSADINLDARKGLPFDKDSVEVVYSEHFLEHLSYPNESAPFLADCYRVLKNGGQIHVGVPDSRYVVESCITDPISPEFLRTAAERNWGYPASCRTGMEYINYHFRLDGQHKFAFDFITLKRQLEDKGFVNVRQREFDSGLDTPSRAHGTLYVVGEKIST